MAKLEENDLNLSDFSEQSEDEDLYNKLLSSISRLGNTQRVKAPTRRELTSEISEFHLVKNIAGVKAKKNSVHVNELAAVLDGKAKHQQIQKKLKKITENNKVLDKPLDTPAADRIKRTIGFENVKGQLKKWEPFVERNRLKDHSQFPLKTHSIGLQNTSKFLSRFKTPTPLEIEIAKVLNGGAETKDKELEEEDDEFPLSVEEMIERRKEMARTRAKQSYREAKFHQQKKIKSKTFHRIQRREKVRKQLKEFEQLQKTNPELALKKLEELDKTRALERASLRHKNTGQWAQNLTVRAKYDIDSRKALAEQLTVSKELSQKTQEQESSDDDGEDVQITESKDNPWTLQHDSEIDDFISGYRKFWDGKNNNQSKEEVNGMTVAKESKMDGNINNDTIIAVPVEVERKSEGKVSNANIVTKKGKKSQKANHNSDSTRFKKAPNKESVGMKKKGDSLSKSDSICLSVQSSSGAWIVNDEEKPSPIKKTRVKKVKRKSDVDIDNMFNNLESKVAKKVKKALTSMEKKVENSKNKKKDKVTTISLKNTYRSDKPERPDEDVELSESVILKDDRVNENQTVASVEVESQQGSTPTQIDPNKFMKLKPRDLNSSIPEDITNGDEGLDDEENDQQMTIMEAFVDDDVVAEFKEQKEDAIKSSQPEEINLVLPGWGEWTGKGILPSKRKKRFIIKPPPVPPRKDEELIDIIINEEDLNIQDHLVKEVPFPFKSTEAFESSLRAPLGRIWVPETAHRKLIKPAVITKLGTVIEPVTEDELVKKNKKFKSVYQGKVKQKKS